MPPYFVALSPHNWVLEMHNLLWRWAEMRGRGECRFFSGNQSLSAISSPGYRRVGRKKGPARFPGLGAVRSDGRVWRSLIF